MAQPSLPPHVLIMSDVPADISLLTLALEPEGYKVTSFFSASSLDLETIAAMLPLPDAIVHDLRLGQNQRAGQFFLRQAQRDPVVCRIPLIIVTMALPRDRGSGMTKPRATAPVRVLAAPIDADLLLETLEEVLSVAPRGVSPLPVPPVRTPVPASRSSIAFAKENPKSAATRRRMRVSR